MRALRDYQSQRTEREARIGDQSSTFVLPGSRDQPSGYELLPQVRVDEPEAWGRVDTPEVSNCDDDRNPDDSEAWGDDEPAARGHVQSKLQCKLQGMKEQNFISKAYQSAMNISHYITEAATVEHLKDRLARHLEFARAFRQERRLQEVTEVIRLEFKWCSPLVAELFHCLESDIRRELEFYKMRWDNRQLGHCAPEPEKARDSDADSKSSQGTGSTESTFQVSLASRLRYTNYRITGEDEQELSQRIGLSAGNLCLRNQETPPNCKSGWCGLSPCDSVARTEIALPFESVWQVGRLLKWCDGRLTWVAQQEGRLSFELSPEMVRLRGKWMSKDDVPDFKENVENLKKELLSFESVLLERAVPSFLYDLTEYQAFLQGRIEQGKSMQTKALAVFISGLLAIGHLFMNYSAVQTETIEFLNMTNVTSLAHVMMWKGA